MLRRAPPLAINPSRDVTKVTLIVRPGGGQANVRRFLPVLGQDRQLGTTGIIDCRSTLVPPVIPENTRSKGKLWHSVPAPKASQSRIAFD